MKTFKTTSRVFHPLCVAICLFVSFSACSSKRSVESYIEDADSLVKEDKIDAALLLYQKGIKEHPKESVLYLNQAALFRTLQKYSSAIRNYETVKRLNPESFWPTLGLGRVYLLEKDYERARLVLEEGLKQFENNGPILFYLGKTYFELHQGDRALECFDQAFAANYKNLNNLYYYRGLTFETLLNNNDRARMDYQSYLLNHGDKSDEIKNRYDALDVNRYNF